MKKMKRIKTVSLLCFLILLSGCSADGSADEKNTLDETEISAGVAEDSIESAEESVEDMEENTDETDSEPVRPEKEEVLAAREKALEGMSEEEAERLTENIKIANLKMEQAYFYDDIFDKLEDPDNLYWNYFDETGEILIGRAYDGERKKEEVMEEENLTEDEFYSKYGTQVIAYNSFDADAFIDLLEDMKASVNDEDLQNDLQKVIDETRLAADTHEVEHAVNIYRLLHDMDYYLLRYGPEDVGKYVQDTSTIMKYYGVLSIYEE